MKYALLILFALLITAPAIAQDATPESGDVHPLVALMEWIPESGMSIESVTLSYADYAAIQSAGMSAENILGALTGDAGSLLQSLRRLNAGPYMIARSLLMMLDDDATPLGFSVVDLERGIEFGEPPSMGIILTGDLNPGLIADAFTSREGYVTAEIGGLPAICSDEGCDEGLQQNLRGTDPSNPFGGQFGRREPMVLLDGAVLNSASLDVVESMVAARSGDSPSLADNTIYAAAAEAITQEGGTLLQAVFVNPISISGTLPGVTPEQIAAMEAQNESLGTLPPYLLVAFADRQEDGTPVTYIALVYADDASAQTAAAEVSGRLREYTSVRTNSGTPVFEGIATVEDGTVYQAADDRFVALVPVRYSADDPEETPPRLVFSTMLQMVYSRDTLFLTVKE